MSAQQAADIQQDDLTEPEPDLHDGRPMRPEFRLRGELLMAQWSFEDA